VSVVDVAIRSAVPADIGVLGDVFRRSSLSNEGDQASLRHHPDALAFSDLPVHQHRTRVATTDGRIVGFATLLITEQVGELEDLFVDPDWMRRGIGQELMLDSVAIARGLGVPRIEVTANGHALGFYEKAGFVLDGVVETRFGPGSRMHLDVFP
jgi:N-acetylglutamate synthase-like GNAT family acetyltransferase